MEYWARNWSYKSHRIKTCAKCGLRINNSKYAQCAMKYLIAKNKSVCFKMGEILKLEKM